MGKKNPELYLPKDGEVLTLRTCDCDLLLEVDFTDDQDKTRSLEWAPIPYDWCPCQKGRSGHTGREHHVKMKAEAALDEANVIRYAEFLQKLKPATQFIVITHRQGTMARVDHLFGATMQQRGATSFFSVDLNKAKELIEENE